MCVNVFPFLRAYNVVQAFAEEPASGLLGVPDLLSELMLILRCSLSFHCVDSYIDDAKAVMGKTVGTVA